MKVESYRYNTLRVVVTDAQDIKADLAISMSFCNVGTIRATVDGIPLNPGEGVLSTPCNYPGLDDGVHRIEFLDPEIGDAKKIKRVLVFRRIVLGDC